MRPRVVIQPQELLGLPPVKNKGQRTCSPYGVRHGDAVIVVQLSHHPIKVFPGLEYTARPIRGTKLVKVTYRKITPTRVLT